MFGVFTYVCMYVCSLRHENMYMGGRHCMGKEKTGAYSDRADTSGFVDTDDLHNFIYCPERTTDAAITALLSRIVILNPSGNYCVKLIIFRMVTEMTPEIIKTHSNQLVLCVNAIISFQYFLKMC